MKLMYRILRASGNGTTTPDSVVIGTTSTTGQMSTR